MLTPSTGWRNQLSGRSGVARLFLSLSFLLTSVVACERDDAVMARASLDNVSRLELVEELRIGSFDDPNLGFTRIVPPIEVLGGDTILVGEGSAGEIRVYSSGGTLVRRIGRSGEGPGELGSISSWGVLGDTVWVLESSRVTLFRRDGSLILANRIQPLTIRAGGAFAMLRPAALQPGGTISSQVMLGVIPGMEQPIQEVQVPMVVYGLSGEVIDTAGYRTMELGQGGRRSRSVPGLPLPIYHTIYPASSDIEHVSNGDTIRIDRPVAGVPEEGRLSVTRVSNGDTVYSRSYTYSPVRVPDTYRDSMIALRVDSYAERVNDIGQLRAAVEEMFEFSPFYPPISDVTATRDGSLWLRRSPESSESWQWIVLDPEGGVVGEVTTPPNATILWSDGETVYVSELDAFDVPWLARYRVE